MTAKDLARQAGVVTLAGALLAGAVGVQRVRERLYPRPEIDDQSLDVTSGAALRHLTLAYQTLAADLYWIRAIQHYGGTKRGLASAQPSARAADTGDYRLLYPLLDLATTLDPRFNIAYRFGAIFLAESYPGGPGRPDLAIALLQKGLRERPDKWEYMQDIGFVHYWWRHDYAAAAAWFQRAGEVPGAPWWLRSLAATTLVQGGDRRSSRMMWESIRQSAEVDWLRQDAEHRLLQLRALDDIDVLQALVDRVSRAAGQTPVDWAPIVRARLLPAIPLDPSGTPYDLDAGGRVRVSRTSALFPLPDEPARIGPVS